ncbi:glycosyltransferase family 4 protein [uncultured Marivirga sp.]|uniref:glycosyltransferase family 4 protein n=1 Tax=uncultured Marivirga sp. TaxID=1123707 RepID=UPI0030ECA238|tara:strand:+ start:33511 stop:34605 length:1095 start_codon:yes stop_codon:yes gene_type:complete
MKVVLFSTQWPEYMVELANGLSKHANVMLMMPNNHRFKCIHASLLDPQIRLVQYKLVLHKSSRDNFKMLFFILKTLWLIKPEILHIQANGHRLFHWVALFKPWKTKIVNTIHDPAKHIGDKASEQINDEFVKNISKYFTHKFIVHGKSLIMELIKNYDVEQNKIVNIPHGHFEIYKKFKDGQFVTKHKNYILFFGRIWKYKGLQYFIDAAAIVLEQFPNTMFYIVGRGESLDNYKIPERLRESLFIENRYVSLSETAYFIENSSFLVLPYLEATQSGVIPLAYAFGKPVIATDVGALSEVVLNNQTGFLLKDANVIALSERMSLFLRDTSLIDSYGQNAYKFAKTHLSWDSIASKTFKSYQKVL